VSADHGERTLTADGQPADLDGWCQCERPPKVAYGTWAADGSQVDRGFICADCRRRIAPAVLAHE